MNYGYACINETLGSGPKNSPTSSFGFYQKTSKFLWTKARYYVRMQKERISLIEA